MKSLIASSSSSPPPPSSSSSSSETIAIGPKVLFVYGDSDQFTGVNKYRKWVQENILSENKNWKVKELAGIDNFFTWQGMEDELVRAIDEWIENNKVNNDG